MLSARPATVDRRFFSTTAEALAQLGFDVAAQCRAHGLPNPLSHPGERLPLAQISPLYDLAAAYLQDPAFVYKLVTRTSHEAASVVFPLVLCCETPVAAMQMACRFAAVASDVCRFDLTDTGTALTLTLTPPASVHVTPYQIELTAWFLIQWLSIVRERCTGALDVRVAFAHLALFAPARYRQLYGAEVHFGAGPSRVTLSGAGLHRPIAGHDTHLAHHYRHHAERYEADTLLHGPLPERVMLLFAQRMAFGKPEADDVAALLHMSRRSLQRQLQAHSTTWQQVMDLARQKVACAELQRGPCSATTLALLTGYEDTRAFLRAFKRWTGCTPSEYRDRLAG